MDHNHPDFVGPIPDEPVAPEGVWCSPESGEYPVGAPLVTSAPPDDSPLAYNEDEFVALWSQIYRIFIRLSYFKENEIIFPPEDTGRHPDINTGRHPGIDKARLRNEFGMSERAISLVERLPYPVKGSGGYQGPIFFWEGRIVDYLDGEKDGALWDCRVPHCYLMDPDVRDDPPERLLVPDDVKLVTPSDNLGVSWILDTKTSESPLRASKSNTDVFLPKMPFVQ